MVKTPLCLKGSELHQSKSEHISHFGLIGLYLYGRCVARIITNNSVQNLRGCKQRGRFSVRGSFYSIRCYIPYTQCPCPRNFISFPSFISEIAKGTDSEPLLHFCAFRLLYAFEFSGLRVTGFRPYQQPRFARFISRCFFLGSFSKRMNFSIVVLLSPIGKVDDTRNAAGCQITVWLNATVFAFMDAPFMGKTPKNTLRLFAYQYII